MRLSEVMPGKVTLVTSEVLLDEVDTKVIGVGTSSTLSANSATVTLPTSLHRAPLVASTSCVIEGRLQECVKIHSSNCLSRSCSLCHSSWVGLWLPKSPSDLFCLYLTPLPMFQKLYRYLKIFPTPK